jgi:hypothetical protein
MLCSRVKPGYWVSFNCGKAPWIKGFRHLSSPPDGLALVKLPWNSPRAMGDWRMAKDHRGFLQRVAALYNLWGLLPSTWHTAAVAVVTAIAGYLGFQTGGFFYALIGAVFVFSTAMVGLFFTMLVFRNISVFGRLAIREIGVQSFSADTQGNFLKEIKGITMYFVVQNNGARDIHFRVLRAPLSILNQVNQEAAVSDLENIVPAGQPQHILLATIDSVKFTKIDLSRPGSKTPITGKIELEIAYGPSDHMPYLLSYAAEISFGINALHQHKNKWQITLHPVNMIKRYDHKKVNHH